MKLVSPLLKHVVYPGLGRTGHFRHRQPEGPIVVTYHGVLPEQYQVLDPGLDSNLVSIASLRRQLQLLKTNYNVISPEQFALWCGTQKPLPARSVLLTCDDGLQNVLTLMSPLMQEQGVSCLFFVTGASLEERPSMLWYEELYLMLLDGPEICDFELSGGDLRIRIAGRKQRRLVWWNLVKRLSQFSRENRTSLLQEIRVRLELPEGWSSGYVGDSVLRSRFCMLTLSELRQLAQGGMSIGSHTLSHPMLSQQTEEAAWAEVSESRIALQRSLNCKIWALAYPFGDSGSVGKRELELAQRAGFGCAFLNIQSNDSVKPSLFALPRIHVTAGMALPEFEAHVSGFYRSWRNRFVLGSKWTLSQGRE